MATWNSTSSTTRGQPPNSANGSFSWCKDVTRVSPWKTRRCHFWNDLYIRHGHLFRGHPRSFLRLCLQFHQWSWLLCCERGRQCCTRIFTDNSAHDQKSQGLSLNAIFDSELVRFSSAIIQFNCSSTLFMHWNNSFLVHSTSELQF